MRNKKIRILAVLLSVLLLCSLFSACGGSGGSEDGGNQGAAQGIGEIAGDYYLDLTDLGMALTMYLRLSDDGTFLFADSIEFDSEKSSGTIESSDDGYIMLYDMVNGEEKTITDGLTSSFSVLEDGNLDFGSSEKIYYGSAAVTGKSADDPNLTVKGILIDDDYEAPDTSSEFAIGSYTAQTDSKLYTVSFYEDDTYLLVESYEEDGVMMYVSTTGTYGISTEQIAFTPDGGDRLSGEVISESEIKIPASNDAESEETLTANKLGGAQDIATLTGQVTAEDETVDVTVILYTDGSYDVKAGEFAESGVYTLGSSAGEFKTYPDHPETDVRGLNQISTVPAGTFTNTDGKLVLTGFRVRTSDNLTRYECEVAQQ